MFDEIQSDPEIMGGTPVFRGTRVPVQTLFDYIEGESTIDEFLIDFPTVKKQQVIQLLLFPEAIDDFISDDNPVRFIDAFVQSLSLSELGFKPLPPPAALLTIPPICSSSTFTAM